MYSKWYKKYQWIDVEIEKNLKDFRRDSFRPSVNSIIPIGTPLDTKKDKYWLKRKQIIIPTATYKSLEEIKQLYQSHGISLGIFKPKKMIDLNIEADSGEWGKRQKLLLSQLCLFEKQPMPLEKIPFKFVYRFTCNDKRCKKYHELSIVDWEIFALYRNLKNNYQYAMDETLGKIKQKWFYDMWSSKRDSYLIVGSRFPSPTFIVLGVFWPPKQ